jgi:ABC-2 type transport system permease protein
VNLAAQNGLYLVLLAVGGVIVPADELPGAMGNMARWLPSGALSEVLHSSLTSIAASPSAWLVVVAWAAVMPVVAARLFRFDG